MLDNLLYGITITDDRVFKKSIHIYASIMNFALMIPSIIVAFLGQTTTIIIVQAIVSTIISLLYFSFSFIPKKRQSEKIKDILSSKDQFFNAAMYCYN